MKHSKIDEARGLAHQAQQHLRQFERELDDVKSHALADPTVDVGSFATFADYFFDGLIADWVVQSRISDSLSRTEDMMLRVARTVGELRGKLGAIEQQIEGREDRQKTLIRESE